MIEYAPRIVHVDTSNVAIDEDTARLLAGLDAPAPRRYVEVDAG